MAEIALMQSEASSASAIQRAIDSLGPEGGRIVLPELEIELDRGIELRSRVELVGQGERTVLRHAPGRLYPLAGYHNYGMLDVPLVDTAGLVPGMTVAVRDRAHQGFFETLARITWVEDGWVGLDTGLHADYLADGEPVLLTSYPLIFGRRVSGVAVRGLTLDGNPERQPAGIGACRGAALYFIHSRDVRVTGVRERGFPGEGLGFQICRDLVIEDCRFSQNAGNGMHPGAGSTGVLVRRCTAERNGRSGFYFCVRANHVSVLDSCFRGNADAGMSVGTRDCHNLIEGCEIRDNDGPGVLFRRCPTPAEVHDFVVSRCLLSGNARRTGKAQVEIRADAHDLVVEDCEIAGAAVRETTGVSWEDTARGIYVANNHIEGCSPEMGGAAEGRSTVRPAVSVGREALRAEHYRHLDTA